MIATTSIFPYNSRMGEYLRATGRSGIADYADSFKANLQADNNVKYDEVIEVSHFPFKPGPTSEKFNLKIPSKLFVLSLIWKYTKYTIKKIDLNQLEPRINGPFSPEYSYTLNEFPEAVKKNGWPENLSVGLIGR